MGRGFKPNRMDIRCRQLFSNKVHWMLEITEITSTDRLDLTYHTMVQIATKIILETTCAWQLSVMLGNEEIFLFAMNSQIKDVVFFFFFLEACILTNFASFRVCATKDLKECWVTQINY